MGETLASAILGGAGSALGFVQNERNIATQKGENAENRAFQAEQNSIDRDWQAQQQETQFNRQADFQKEMFRLQNEYNLPANQIARLQAAGINPSALLGQNSSSISTGSSPSVPTAPSGGALPSHGVSPTAGIQTQNYIPAMFSSLAQMQDSVSRMSLNKTQKNAINAKLGEEVEKLRAEAELARSQSKNQEEQATLTALNKTLLETYGHDKNKAEIAHLINQSYQAYTSGNLNKANKLLADANIALTNQEKDFKASEYPLLLNNLKALGDVYRSEESKNYASAAQSRAQASLNSALEAIANYDKEIKSVDAQVARKTILDKLDKSYQEALAAGYITDEIREKVDKLKTQNSFEALQQLGNLLKTVVPSGASQKVKFY